eukprot:m.208235 g.208235  ORF g.208235 m.208235 type:complete len:61 (+) comp17798_c1_seq1:5739-5921(+)
MLACLYLLKSQYEQIFAHQGTWTYTDKPALRIKLGSWAVAVAAAVFPLAMVYFSHFLKHA